MRTISMFFIILMMSFGARAESSPLKVEDDGIEVFEMSEELVNDALKQVMDVLINCEMDDICILDKFDEIAKMAPKDLDNPLVQLIVAEIYAELGSKEIAKIRENEALCSIEQIKQVRSKIAKCFIPIRDMLANPDSSIQQKSQEHMMCMMTEFDKLIADGNPYAYKVMIEFFFQAGEEELANELMAEVQELAKDWSDEDIDRFNTCTMNWAN